MHLHFEEKENGKSFKIQNLRKNDSINKKKNESCMYTWFLGWRGKKF